MSSWRQQRDAMARAKGYADYGEYRALGSGRLAPGTPRPSGEEARRFQGHRGAGDLERLVKRGDLLVLGQHISEAGEKDSKGRYREVRIVVTDDKTGKDRTFVLRRLTPARLRALSQRLDAKGTTFSPAPSRDVRRL